MTIKELKNMDLAQVKTRLAALDAEVEKLGKGEATEEAVAQVNAAAEEKRMLTGRLKDLEDMEKRRKDAQTLAGGAAGVPVEQRYMDGDGMSVIEKRARTLVETGKMELRQLLGTGVLTPTALKQEIGELPAVMSSIVDDVHSFDATGCGVWGFSYRDTDGVAAAVTDGEKVGGTPGTFQKGTVTPSEWGILDEISNQVKKFTPLAYEQSVRNNAYLALRRYAKKEIVKAILGSDLVEKIDTMAIDVNFVRTLVLGFNADEGVAGGAKLYLTKATLQKLGKIRGANEKKALFEIAFTDDNNGRIKDGGLEVAFSILSDLGDASLIQSGAEDVMIYGQMMSVDMPLWGNYEIKTDEGGSYFDRNMMGVRGLQTAGVGVTRLHTVQVINNKAAEAA